jgi:hypothetical protein
MSTSPDEPHPLDSVAALATILNDVAAFSVRRAFLDVHWLFADNAGEKIDQRAFIVVRMTSSARRLRHFFAFRPISTRRRMASDSFGLSGCDFAHFSMEVRSSVSALKPIIGRAPVAGLPLFCLADIAFFIFSV